ncbi:MAG: hypothetical protein ABEI54_04040 [Candidatus Bipolaricaulia bacterium]
MGERASGSDRWAVRDSAPETLERDKIGQLILNVLVNNNPYVFSPQGIELQPSTLNFFKKISEDTGPK